jgi:hypothetical protein
VEAFRTRPLDAGPYTFVAADALVLKLREAGRTVNVYALLATGVNADGYREILGLHVTSAEDGAGWLGFFGDLTARGLTGVRLVTSDAHRGLVEAIGATLPGAAWQRCRTQEPAEVLLTYLGRRSHLQRCIEHAPADIRRPRDQDPRRARGCPEADPLVGIAASARGTSSGMVLATLLCTSDARNGLRQKMVDSQRAAETSRHQYTHSPRVWSRATARSCKRTH